MNNENKDMIKKVNYFLEKKLKVHITKKNKNFLNGYFEGKVGDNIYLFKDDKLGVVEVFVSEIFDIIRYNERGSEN